jgi:hypothetical protein
MGWDFLGILLVNYQVKIYAMIRIVKENSWADFFEANE